MISINNLLDMVHTEAITGENITDREGNAIKPEPPENITKLPPIDYKLELIEKFDGKYEWVED